MAIHRVEAIRSLHKGSYDKATADKIDWKDGHTTTDAENTAIDAEIVRLQTLEDYQAPRKAEYDQLNQFEMQFDDKENTTTTWVDKINEIKGRHPK